MYGRQGRVTSHGQEVAPGIVVYENTMQGCSALIREVEALHAWESSVVKKPNGESTVVSDVRRNDVVRLTLTDGAPAAWRDLSQTLWEYGQFYAQRCGVNVGTMETPQLLRYRSDEESFFKVHADEIGTRGRKFSCVLYLNDVSVGGETRFANFDVRIRPREARMAFFPSAHPYEHEALPPQSATKYSVVTWFHASPISLS